MVRAASSNIASRRRRHGSVLIVAILIVFTVAGMVVVLCRSMAVEAVASANQAAAAQAASIERGAEQYILGMLAELGPEVLDLPEEEFAGVPVGDGWFWVLRPGYDDESLPAFGLVDECSKLDINSADVDMLLRLPGMTEDVAAAIVDWRDGDSNVTSAGAESEYYLSLPQPYVAKNERFETVEELLLVRGATMQLLYGDGTAQPLGSNSSVLASSSSGNPLYTSPQLARGLFDLLTVHSIQRNRDADGNRRININQQNQRDNLRNRLRQILGARRGTQVVNSMGGGNFRDVFDFYFRARLTADEFERIADYVTTSNSNNLRGRVNVNTAPRDVLLCLDGLDSSDVDALISARGGANGAASGSFAWVADVLQQKAIGLGERITGSSTRYSADILAVSGNGRAFKRCRIVLDTRQSPPRVRYRRDMTDRGWPMDPALLASLRAGQGPAASFGAGFSSFGGGGASSMGGVLR